jgi:hypothetical protein
MSSVRKKKMLLLAAVTCLVSLPLISRAQYQFGERVWSAPGPGATVWSVAPGATNLDRGFPFPFFPFDDLTNIPLYSLGDDSYVFEFDWGSYQDLTGREDDGDAGPLDPQWNFGTNLWIEILGVTNKLAYLRLHNTTNIDGGQYYQLLSAFRLDVPLLQWMRGQILQDTNNTGHIDFDPVPAAAGAQFFRGLEGGTNLSVFTLVATNIPGPVGIAHHAPSNMLVLSLNYQLSLVTNLFGSLSSNGALGPWSCVSNGLNAVAGPETEIATVRTSTNGFVKGEMFFTSTNGMIGWVSADGSSSNLSWAVLVSDPSSPLYGPVLGLYVDEPESLATGWWPSLVPAVARQSRASGLSIPTGRLFYSATNYPTFRPEGIITIPSNTTKYGIFAGNIVFGDEDEATIYTVDTNGLVSAYDTTGWVSVGIKPESFAIIQTNQNLYAVNSASDTADSRVLKVSQFALSKYFGDLLVADEKSATPKLAILHWDALNSRVVPFLIPLPATLEDGFSLNGDFEGVASAPLDVPNLRP